MAKSIEDLLEEAWDAGVEAAHDEYPHAWRLQTVQARNPYRIRPARKPRLEASPPTTAPACTCTPHVDRPEPGLHQVGCAVVLAWEAGLAVAARVSAGGWVP